jgi:hypothetical protein
MRFDGLRETLLKGGVAPRHVHRYLAELSAHLADLTDEQRKLGYEGDDAALRARALLGEDRELAAAMLEQKSLRSLPARAPWLVFGLLPPVTGIGAAFILISPLVLSAQGLHLKTPAGLNAPQWFRSLAFGLAGLGNVALGPALAVAFALLAMRQRTREIWPLIAILLIAALDLHFQVEFPAAGHRGGSIGIGAAAWLSHWQSWIGTWPMSLARLLLTSLPAMWLFRKRATAG